MSTTQRIDRKEFRRVRATKDDKAKSQGAENEIRVTAQRGQRSYISYAIAVLNGEEDKTKQDTIKISGMGAAIYNAVNVAEIVKRRVKGLHQIAELSSETVKDSYEGIESKKTLDVERKVATILITLSTKKLDTKNVGYQAPLPEDQVTEQEDRKPSERRPRGSGRGGRGGRGSARGGRGGSRGRGGKDAAAEKKDDKPAAAGGRGSTRGGRGGAAPAEKKDDKKVAAPKTEEKKAAAPKTEEKKAAAPKADKPKVAAKDYQKEGDDFEDKFDRLKGDGHNKQTPKGQSKPKSVRTN